MTNTILRILETPEELHEVENLQRLIWPGNETEVLPGHLMLAACHNGGLAIGAYIDDALTAAETVDDPLPETPATAALPNGARLAGFVFGFPGLYFTPDGPRPKHCSHMLGVDPNARGHWLGFLLKRAQWQMIRRQGLDRITWTFDPLLSLNAHLNIARLGAVCSTYLHNAYGELRDGLNAGLPTDRFQVDWWINTSRVQRRLGTRARPPLDLAHFLSAGTELLNPAGMDEDGLLRPAEQIRWEMIEDPGRPGSEARLVLAEIPSDFQSLRKAKPPLALEWRLHTRTLFERLFAAGYLVTDFVQVDGPPARSFYALVFGESTF